MKLKIGDSVNVDQEVGCDEVLAQTGIIIWEPDPFHYGVEFDSYINGHDCKGKGRNGYCWNVWRNNCKKIKGIDVIKLNDFVRVSGGAGNCDEDLYGVIVDESPGFKHRIGVEFSAYIGGHDCHGKGEYGFCEYVLTENCTKVSEYEYMKNLDELSVIDDGYKELDEVFNDAYDSASIGKGKERHADDNNYEDQVICVVQRLLKDHPFGGQAFQVIKKTIEAGRLYKIKGKDAAYKEILGAINYAAAMGILIKED